MTDKFDDVEQANPLYGGATRHRYLPLPQLQSKRMCRWFSRSDANVEFSRIIYCIAVAWWHSESLSGVAEFRGRIAQVPPMYSAIRIGGRRLYELARKGVEVERPARNVRIHKLDIAVYAPPLLHLDVHCSKGTYIRSLADDIGKRLGCGAHLSTLRRTAVGCVELGQCIAVYGLERAECISDVLLNPHAVLSDLSSVCLTEAQQGRFSNGNPVTDILLDVQDIVTVQNSRGVLLGLGHIVEGVLKPIRVIQN